MVYIRVFKLMVYLRDIYIYIYIYIYILYIYIYIYQLATDGIY